MNSQMANDKQKAAQDIKAEISTRSADGEGTPAFQYFTKSSPNVTLPKYNRGTSQFQQFAMTYQRSPQLSISDLRNNQSID